MQNLIYLKNSTRSTKNWRPWRLRRGPYLLVLILATLLLATLARAVVPPPDGGYANGNTAEGGDALFSLTTGLDNTANGFNALFFNTIGCRNTATGFDALLSNSIGCDNTADGAFALDSNITGKQNTAAGVSALTNNTTGKQNTASGYQALQTNTTGNYNTAQGWRALATNNADNNTATGYQALETNGTGSLNTATGVDALHNNMSGSNNTATGAYALLANDTGGSNTATGVLALQLNNGGSNNTADGLGALGDNTTGDNNTAIGYTALALNSSGDNNIALGVSAGISLTTGDNNIDIGNAGVGGESNAIRIGTTGTQTNTYIAGISGVTVAKGVGVIVDSSGHLGTVVSSERFKDAIQPMDKASEAILSLQPVTFHYKHELDPDGIPQFGLVAEEVEKVNPDLVAHDGQGKPYTVRYDAVNAMLLNEFLKAHRKLEEQAQINQQQEATITRLEAVLKEQTTQIQKVCEQLSGNKPAPPFIATTCPKKHPKQKI